MPEKVLMQAILDAARWQGWLCHHVFDSRRSSPGFPDVVCVRNDRCIAIETKSARGRVSPYQREWLDALARAGVETFVVYPHGLDEILEVLAA